MPDINGKWTMVEYTELKRIMATGISEAEFDGPDGERRVKYHGFSALVKLKRLMEKDLGICRERGRIRMTTDKGYDK